MTANMGNFSAMLRSSEDWEAFWFALEGMAGSSENSVFKFVDVYDKANLLSAPELPKIPEAPELPRRPVVTESVNDSQANQLHTLLLTEHRYRHAAYVDEKTRVSKQWERYDALSGWVRQHVHPDNYVYMRNEKTLFRQLLALKSQFAPTDRARELLITRTYNEARTYRDNQPVIRWLEAYQQAYEKAREINIPETTGYRAYYDFIYAIKVIDGEYSKYLLIQLEKKRKKDKVPSLAEIIEDFRNHQRQEEASMEFERDTRQEIQGQGRLVAANFKDTGTESENKTNFDDKKCLCGSTHAWAKCFYLNPSLRTSTWKGKRDVFDKINKKLKHPKLRWVKKKYGYDDINGENMTDTGKACDSASKSFGADTSRPSFQKAAAILTRQQLVSSIDEKSATKEKDKVRYAFSNGINEEQPADDSFHLFKKWIIDNGADTHVTNSDIDLEETRIANAGELLYAGRGAYPIKSYGNVRLQLKSNIAGEYLLLKEVAYVPGFMTNCVSLDRLTKADIHWSSKNPSILERDGDPTPFCHLYQMGSHWVFEEPYPNSALVSNTKRTSVKKRTNRITAAKAHMIMGHAGHDTISRLQENCEGIEIDFATPCPRVAECTTCACAKAHEIVSRRSDVEFPSPSGANFYRTNQDIIPFEPSYNGHNYATHTQCDTSRYAILDTHKGKAAACQTSINHIKRAENQFDVRVRIVKTDGEAVFNSKEWVEFAAGKGIVREMTAPDTSEQNGKSEAAGKWIVVISRSMLLASGLPNSIFSEALKCGTYIYNRLPRKFLAWKSPFELVTGRKPDLSHMHPFGCRVYVFQHNIPRLKKMQPRALIGYLVGYDSRNIYRVWMPSKEKVIRTRDVVFNDDLFYNPSEMDIGVLEDDETVDFLRRLELPWNSGIGGDESLYESELVLETEDTELGLDTNSEDEHETEKKNGGLYASGHNNSYIVLPTPSPSPPREEAYIEKGKHQVSIEDPFRKLNPVQNSLPKACSETQNQPQIPTVGLGVGSFEVDSSNILEGKRQRKKRIVQCLVRNNQNPSFHMAFAASRSMVKSVGLHVSELPPPPRNYKEMLKHEYMAGFRAAQLKELEKLIEMEAVQFVRKSELGDCRVEQVNAPLPLMWVFTYKLDPDGYLISFKARIVARGDLQTTEEDTYAATATAYATRAIASIIGAHGLRALQYDAINAYGNSRKEIPLYTKCPPGFEHRGDGLLVFFGMYGLKPSALDWYKTYKSAALEIGLSIVPGSPSIFQNSWLIMIVYVDDILIAYHPRHDDKFRAFETKFLQMFEFRKLGNVENFIGVRFERDEAEKKLWLVQDSFISKLEEKFKINIHAKHRIPLPSNPLQPYDGIASPSQIHQYQQKAGSVNWLAVLTRPDISWSVSELSKYLQNPGPQHLDAVNHLLEYLSGTKYLALEYDGNTPPNLCMGYSDASFADEIPSRHSSHGYAFSLYGGLITWKAQKQRTVTTSTTESELLALSQAGREVIWWERFFKDIGFALDEEITLYCDNRQALRVVTSEVSKLDTKLRHVDIHQMWLRQEVQNGRIKVEWIGTDRMIADGFTKALSHSKHARFVEMIGLREISTRLTHKSA
ncbi:BgTH12-06853 [Blumeria graminis f. sp. triticale]|uniref:BgTH12-06853 n=1 Tax=Blumeria graminis f. sp. triticale TaxID=1689686 RepID=A0A9W4D883_BLUGR|nr:BgTH12-06853 [Blumeria graminis f. sp. triticale]